LEEIKHNMAEKNYEYGMIGLGTMGRNLVLNISDHGFSVAGFDKDAKQVELLKKEADKENVMATSNLEEFVKSLKTPRTIILLVPAGEIVDEVINELKPLLSEDDLLMDCGNSHFTDTDRRIEELANSNIHFMGIGVSGGESGARYGPSIMPGGPKKIYERVADMLEAISAKVEIEPCVAWLGPGSAGHYVKMVHNGIEYGLMQLLSEAYHLLKVAGSFNNEGLHVIFSNWNKGILKSFLIEITAEIFLQNDELTHNSLIDKVLDSAHQKGTGGWTSQDAMKLQVPIPVIDTAVSMRDLSVYKKEREMAHKILEGPGSKLEDDKKALVTWLEQALYFSMITTYAQGLSLLYTASKEYKYYLTLEDIATIWRGGCIIRSSLLEDIRVAFSKQPDLSNIMLDEKIAQKLMHAQIETRKIVQIGVETGIPIPALMGSLAYYDSYRSGWLPANLIQAQRDYFGAHTYERNDRKGIFHTQWNQKNEVEQSMLHTKKE
jgi:6-phosphogluconate dehydrogenase